MNVLKEATVGNNRCDLVVALFDSVDGLLDDINFDLLVDRMLAIENMTLA